MIAQRYSMEFTTQEGRRVQLSDLLKTGLMDVFHAQKNVYSHSFTSEPPIEELNTVPNYLNKDGTFSLRPNLTIRPDEVARIKSAIPQPKRETGWWIVNRIDLTPYRFLGLTLPANEKIGQVTGKSLVIIWGTYPV